MTTGTATPTRRPRNRRQQIIVSAARQFRTLGYHNVGITGIAEAVGITSAALYRHFNGKPDLLRATIQDTVERMSAAWEATDQELDPLIAAAVAMPIHGPEVGVLWTREVTHLPREMRHELRSRVVQTVQPIRAALTRTRPDLGAADVDFLLWAVVGGFASDTFHSVRLDATRYQQRMAETCLNIARTRLPELGPDVPPVPRKPLTMLPASRREAILTSAIRLFAERGYQEVGVDDIGAETGITGATIYHHFQNKAAILAAALQRCLEVMWFDLAGALDASSTPGEALNHALAHYVRACVERGTLLLILQNEAVNLPEVIRTPLFQAQKDYRNEWVTLLVAHRPELTQAEAELLVRTALSIMTGLVGIRHLHHRPLLAADLHAVGSAAIGLVQTGTNSYLQ